MLLPYYPIKLLSKTVDVILLSRSSRLYEEYISKRKPVILESATGFGLNLSLVLEKALSLEGKVYSIDISRYSISWANLVYGSFIKKGVLAVEVGDLRKLHYNDSTFDYSVNHTTMHHLSLSDVEGAVRELWRTLKKGGVLIVVDINPLPVGLGSHSPGHLKKVKEAVRSSVESLFKIVEAGGSRVVYYIVAEKP